MVIRKKARTVSYRYGSLANFFRLLGKYLAEGVSVSTALQELIRNASGLQWHLCLWEIHKSLHEDGSRLSQAFLQSSYIFPPFVATYVNLAEQSGDVAGMCYKIAEYMDWKNHIRKQWRQHKNYLMLVLGFLVASLSSIVTFLVPVAREFFVENPKDLPVATEAIFAISENLGHISVGTMAFCLAMAFFIRAFLKSDIHPWRPLYQRFKRKLIMSLYLTRTAMIYDFWFHLHQLLAAAIPLHVALMALVRTLPDAEAEIKPMHARLMAGDSAMSCFAKSRLLSNKHSVLWANAQSSNNLADASLRIAMAAEEELRALVNKVIMLAQPVGLVILASLLLAIVLSLFMPLYGL